MEKLTSLVIKFLARAGVDGLLARLESLRWRIHVARLNREHGKTIRFVEQGPGGLCIAGNITRFEIDPTSHLKSGTFIECSGGVRIGRYFHTGRGLTIFSTSHNYLHGKAIPYDDVDLERPVVIGDFVWCGANVTILPGAKLGEGCVIGAGSVVAGEIPACAVAAGNPAKVVKFRDRDRFLELKQQGKFA